MLNCAFRLRSHTDSDPTRNRRTVFPFDGLRTVKPDTVYETPTAVRPVPVRRTHPVLSVLEVAIRQSAPFLWH